MKWLADENLRSAIIRGVLRRKPDIDIIRAQDISDIAGHNDVELLRFATAAARVVITHDLSTMVPAMQEQLRSEMPCAPIVFVPDSMPVSDAIQDLLLLDECSIDADWEAGVIYIPLR